VIVDRGFEGLYLPFERFVIGIELGVVLDELVELRADPVGVAGAPCLLPAVMDERLAMSQLLFCGERHMESLF
jgi:hypothetical protein